MDFIQQGFFKIKGKKGSVEKFKANYSQTRIIERIENAKKQDKRLRLIILKGRQVGGTSLIQRIALSYVLTRPNFRAYTVAHDFDSVTQIFQNHIKFSFDNLPEGLKFFYNVNRSNSNELNIDKVRMNYDSKIKKHLWENWNSNIKVGQSARSQTVDFLHVSEVAKLADDKKKWDELIRGSFPATESGDIILETTARGYNGFYDFYNNTAENSIWEPLFLSWADSPEYQLVPPDNDRWVDHYKKMAENFGLHHDPVNIARLTLPQFYWYYEQVKTYREFIKQEYPLTPEEAFVSSSLSYFALNLIDQALLRIRVENIIPKVKQSFHIFKEPVPGMIYAIGVDCATGAANDNSCIQVICVNTGEQVAVTAGKFSEEETAILAYNAGLWYNEAILAVEINNMGRAVLKAIRNLDYPEDKLYRRIEVDPASPSLARVPYFGWSTNLNSRPTLLSQFRAAFENGAILVNDEETLKEMRTFVNNSGKYEAQVGYHDDRVFALMIAYQAMLYASNY